MPRDPRIEGRAVQWSDLTGNGRRIVSENLREAGAGIKGIAQGHVDALARSAKATPGKVRTAQAVADRTVPVDVTLQKAANTRQGFYNRAIEARREEHPDDPNQVIPRGAGWYFEHNREISESVAPHGVDADRAIAASGVMSPMNSPDNERAAVAAIAEAKSKHSVKVTPEVASHLKVSKSKSDPSFDVDDRVGAEVPIKDLPTGALAKLSDKNVRSKVQTGANLEQVARGGVRGNIQKAEEVLDGVTSPDDAVDPHSAPKVWSYVHNTRQAKPGSATHVEYMGRVHQDALVRTGQIEKEQEALDLYGFAEAEKRGELPDDHLLSSKSHTVEDTWQNAATFNQPNVTVPGTKTSVYKAGGSFSSNYPVGGLKTRTSEETGKKETAHPDARVSGAGLQHAFNNRATQKAAEQQGRGSGVTLPPVAMQEVGWTQMRKEAGKDPAHNAGLRGRKKEADPNAGQGVLPGMEVFNDRRKR